MKRLLLTTLALSLCACANQQAAKLNQKKLGTQETKLASEAGKKKRKVVCVTEYPVGSHVPERVCTPEDDDAMDLENKQRVKEMGVTTRGTALGGG